MVSTHNIIFQYFKNNNIQFEKNKVILTDILIGYIYDDNVNGISIHIYDKQAVKLWEMQYNSELLLIYSNTFLSIYEIFPLFPTKSDILSYRRNNKIGLLI